MVLAFCRAGSEGLVDRGKGWEGSFYPRTSVQSALLHYAIWTPTFGAKSGHERTCPSTSEVKTKEKVKR